MTLAHVPWPVAWLLSRDQGRSTLVRVFHSMKPSASKSAKRMVLHALASTYPCNAILFQWRLVPSPACICCVPVFGGEKESLAHAHCVCPALQEARIGAHHNLVTLLWGRLGQALVV